MANNIVPRSDGGCNLGTPAKEFDKIYAKDIGGTLATKLAPLASPTLTGVPAAPTAAAGTSTTQIATTAFAAAAVSAHNADTGAHSGIIGSAVSTHNSSNAAHSDIRTAVSGKADGACPIKAWGAGTTYSVNDIVVQNKKIYQCITANSDAAFDAAKWQEIGSASTAVNAHNSATDAHSTIFATKQDKLADTVDYVIDSYSDSSGNWWRKYKSGWLEQGGRLGHSATQNVNNTVTLLKPFANTVYDCKVIGVINVGNQAFACYVTGQTTETFTFSFYNTLGAYYGDAIWSACGQGATE